MFFPPHAVSAMAARLVVTSTLFRNRFYFQSLMPIFASQND